MHLKVYRTDIKEYIPFRDNRISNRDRVFIDNRISNRDRVFIDNIISNRDRVFIDSNRV